jgi:hypothetical protein
MEEKTAGAAPPEHPGHASGCFFCGIALPLLERCFTESTRGHFRNSRVEFLKGIRSLIDERIAHLSHEGESRGTHVTVE